MQLVEVFDKSTRRYLSCGRSKEIFISFRSIRIRFCSFDLPRVPMVHYNISLLRLQESFIIPSKMLISITV